MPSLYPRFTEFPDLLDYRQDSYIEVQRTLRTLNTFSSDDPDELLRVIAELDPDKVLRNYSYVCREHGSRNRALYRAISGISFRPFKHVLGDSDYV